MNITMPLVDTPPKKYLSDGRLFIAVSDRCGEVYTVARYEYDVVYFGTDGAIEIGPLDYFEENFTLIRPYNKGESLTITE